MSSDTITGLRAQILSNAKLLLRPRPGSTKNSIDTTMLIDPSYQELDVVVFGSSEYTAAVMVGLTPAIEGPQTTSLEGAMRKLLMATCELLSDFVPKVGSHQRNIHGGGIFDSDLISQDLQEAQKKAP